MSEAMAAAAASSEVEHDSGWTDLFPLPWTEDVEVSDDERIFQRRMVFVAVLLAVVTAMSQWRRPAPYGRFDPKDGTWGPRVNQRIGHVLNDGLWGVLYFLVVYFSDGNNWKFNDVNCLLVVAWLAHFVQRGFIHPFLMQYSCPTIPLGIPITGLTLAFFAYLHAKFFSMVTYKDAYIRDPRFMLGLFIFVVGYFINRASDYKLRSLRANVKGDKKYYIPREMLFSLVSCPNYFGELLEWFGWALATWSPCAFAYFLFVAATFIPRARHTHLWYLENYKNYPRSKKALVPFIF